MRPNSHLTKKSRKCLFLCPVAGLCHFLENNNNPWPGTLVMWLLLSRNCALNDQQTNLICPQRKTHAVITPPWMVLQQLCVFTWERGLHLHAYAYACTCDVWNWTPLQGAGQVTPLPGCNRKLLWPLPRSYSLTPTGIKELLSSPSSLLTIGPFQCRIIACSGGERTGLVKREFGFVADHVAIFTRSTDSCFSCKSGLSEVCGCSCGACAVAVCPHTYLMVSLTESYELFTLVDLFKFSFPHQHSLPCAMFMSTLQIHICNDKRVFLCLTHNFEALAIELAFKNHCLLPPCIVPRLSHLGWGNVGLSVNVAKQNDAFCAINSDFNHRNQMLNFLSPQKLRVLSLFIVKQRKEFPVW